MVDNRVDVSALPPGRYHVTYASADGETYTTPFIKL